MRGAGGGGRGKGCRYQPKLNAHTHARTQVAANTRGIQLVGELIAEYGLGVVTAFMRHIQVRLWERRVGERACVCVCRSLCGHLCVCVRFA